jgi:osmotically inducible protein OsmC
MRPARIRKAAAHAGCFAMALSGKLTGAGFPPEKLNVRSNLTLEQVQESWTITAIHPDLSAKIQKIDRAKFETLAADAKATCPVSRLLKANITLDAKLEA